MDDIFSFLNLDKNASREELKAAFIAWKKSQQQILQTGTRKEQAQASHEISKMTMLYKKACGIPDSTNVPRKHEKVANDSNSIREMNNLSQISSKSRSLHSENNSQKILNVIFCVIIILLGSTLIYFYHEDSLTPAIFTFQDKPQNTITNNKSTEKIINSSIENEPVIEDKNIGKTPSQREAIQIFLEFHENITKKSLRQAYDCMSNNLQDEISYEGWIPGFNTTVSSIPSNINIVSESESHIILTYDLNAVDNPGGTQIFEGTVVMVKTPSGWKIDDVNNKIKK